MSTSGSRPALFRRWLAGARRSRLRRDERGSVAVEFGLIALMLFSFIGLILEMARVGWAQMSLQQAVADAGRQIYTGQFQKNASKNKITGTTALLSAFRDELCKENGQPRMTLFDCGAVRINVTVPGDFGSAAPASPTTTTTSKGTTSTDWNPSFGKSYSCADGSSIVMIQAAVGLPVLFAWLDPSAVTLPDNKRLLQSAVVFRTEPYDAGACS